MTHQWNNVDKVIKQERLNDKKLFRRFYVIVSIFFTVFILIQLISSNSWIAEFLFEHNIDQMEVILSFGLIAIFVSMGFGSIFLFKDSRIKSWLKPLILPLGFLAIPMLISIIYLFF